MYICTLLNCLYVKIRKNFFLFKVLNLLSYSSDKDLSKGHEKIVNVKVICNMFVRHLFLTFYCRCLIEMSKLKKYVFFSRGSIRQ